MTWNQFPVSSIEPKTHQKCFPKKMTFVSSSFYILQSRTNATSELCANYQLLLFCPDSNNFNIFFYLKQTYFAFTAELFISMIKLLLILSCRCYYSTNVGTQERKKLSYEYILMVSCNSSHGTHLCSIEHVLIRGWC